MSLPASWVEKQQPRHGMSKSRVYGIWAGMVTRCHTSTAKDFQAYGGKGIAVCDRWRRFDEFYADMGNPGKHETIDRIDGARGYEPGNCRWATRKEQNRNKAGLCFVTINGRTQCLSAWAEEAGIGAKLIRARLSRGWSAVDALATPARPHKPYERRT